MGMYTLSSLWEKIEQQGGDRDEVLFEIMSAEKDGKVNLYEEIESLYMQLFDLYEDREDAEGLLLKRGIISLKSGFRDRYSLTTRYYGKDNGESYADEQIYDLYTHCLMLDFLGPLSKGLLVPNNIDSTTLAERECTASIPVLKDTGDAVAFGALNTDEFQTAWGALVDAAEAGAVTDLNTWFEIKTPMLDKSFFFAGVPSRLGMAANAVNSLATVNGNVTPTKVGGWAAKSTSTPSYCGKSNPDAEYTCARCYAALEAIAAPNTNSKSDKSSKDASDTSAGVTVGYAVETTAGTRPTTGYKPIPDITVTPEIDLSPPLSCLTIRGSDKI